MRKPDDINYRSLSNVFLPANSIQLSTVEMNKSFAEDFVRVPEVKVVVVVVVGDDPDSDPHHLVGVVVDLDLLRVEPGLLSTRGVVPPATKVT